MEDWRSTFVDQTRAAFLLQRKLAERAVAQLDDAEIFRAAGAEDNSIAVLMKHVGGNLRSRWTEPFTTDGEKPDRDRDSEFVVDSDDAGSVRAVWDRGWGALDETLRALRPEDVQRVVVIRGEEAGMIEALQRSLAHTAQHVGQIIMLAKQWKGVAWQTLSIARGRSAEHAAKPLR